jgi:outer membrane protein assembly factor BamA
VIQSYFYGAVFGVHVDLKTRTTSFLSTALLLLSVVVALAQPDSLRRKRLTGFPIIGYNPETSVILGAGGFYGIKPSDSLTRLSFVNGNGLFTFRKQWQVSLGLNYFSREEKYYLQGNVSYNDFPLFFYGIGENINIRERELFSSNNFRFQAMLYRSVREKLFVGGGLRYGNVHRLGFPQNGILEELAPTGLFGNYYAGTQLGVLLDNRDSQLTPGRGWFLNATQFFHHRGLGSEYTFTTYQFDARHYIPISKKRGHVLAFQALGIHNTGDVPFTELALLGGDNAMRGYYLGKYRDKNYWTAQAEYRHRINSWLGVVGFAGLGSIAPTLREFETATILPNYGAGLRIKIIPSENINLRIDYGRGRDTGNFYFGISEAF